MPHPGRMTTQKAKDFKGTMRSLLAELGHYKFRLIAVIVFFTDGKWNNSADPFLYVICDWIYCRSIWCDFLWTYW